MKYSTKLAREYKWLEYDSIRSFFFFPIVILLPLIIVIMIFYDNTNGFKSAFEVNYTSNIAMIISLMIILPLLYYAFQSTAKYEIGYVHNLYEPEFKKPLVKFINKHFEKDLDQDYYQPPNKNFKILGLYTQTDQELKIQIQYISNLAFQKSLVEIRIGVITKDNYLSAAQIIKAINNEFLKHEKKKN